ncbi:MAG: M56 family metallopeptidase, partial [Clostridiales bacterium]|nr:M56 family metallopeptidase [Clostridiales bacterium]
MREILITSTVLIAALLVLRWVFRRTLSRRVQYALWALVLVRLLVPASLPEAEFSVLTAVSSQGEAVAVSQAGQAAPIQSEGSVSTPQPSQQSQPGSDQAVLSKQSETAAEHPVEKPALPQVLKGIWAVGMILVGGFFLLSNLRFWRRLCRERELYPVEGFSRRVYLIRDGEGRSPFLFGLVRPAVYLTPAVAVSSPETLCHVLVHEDTHARHLDSLWALLRCVCLTIYWFDPMVWAAAACAKTDCELACDEGALARLGEDQRIPYGQTILALIPVGRGSGNPFLTASTMAARKRQMEDRITRIAQGPRQVLAAAVAVVLLMAGVTACTFTGGAEAGGPAALTGEELQFFNEVYFNGDGYNIRNQFLSSTYETPQDIDLYELFYCEGSTPSDEELRTVLGTAPDNLVCPAFKITTREMNQILIEYMGLTLEETNKTSLRFDYDAASDAYYHMHGDTNYRSYVFFPVGTRDGKEVKLYYQDDFMADGWKCLTLQDQGGGNYHFVSNLPCAKPSIPTDYPDETPDITLPLTELQPYEAPVVSTEPHVGDYVTFLENWDFDGHHV